MKLEPFKTAVLTLDLQKGILAMGDGYESIIPNASKIVGLARKKNYQLIHVGLGFSEGHPEVADLDTPFLKAKQNNLFVKGSPSAEFHSAIVQPNDLIIYKQRIGAFSENHLNLTLRARGIENLVLFGISTSGIVLATVTRAFDLDFKTYHNSRCLPRCRCRGSSRSDGKDISKTRNSCHYGRVYL